MSKTVESITIEMLKKTYKKRDGYNNKSEIARAIGIHPTEFYAFFRGNKLLTVNQLTLIAKFFKLGLDAVRKEHIENHKRFMEGII